MFPFLLDLPLALIAGFPSDYKVRMRALEFRGRAFRANLAYFSRISQLVSSETDKPAFISKVDKALETLKKEYNHIFEKFKEDELYFDTVPLLDWAENSAKAWDKSMIDFQTQFGLPPEMGEVRDALEELWDGFFHLEKSDGQVKLDELMTTFEEKINLVLL